MTLFGRASGAALMIAAALAISGPAWSSPVCLETYRIQDTTVPNVHTIDFHMADGTIWRNTLHNACPGLKWWGFTYLLRGTDEICENMQAIQVIHTHESCLLGSFTKIPPRV